MKRNAFTMVELVFVIVILGVLASVAIPRIAASRTDAEIAKYKSDISAIRSSIVTKRSQNLMSGDSSYPNINKAYPPTDVLFDNVLDYPVKISTSQNGWKSGGGDENLTKFTLGLDSTPISFEYNKSSGIFTCVDKNTGSAKDLCETLVY